MLTCSQILQPKLQDFSYLLIFLIHTSKGNSKAEVIPRTGIHQYLGTANSGFLPHVYPKHAHVISVAVASTVFTDHLRKMVNNLLYRHPFF